MTVAPPKRFPLALNDLVRARPAQAGKAAGLTKPKAGSVRAAVPGAGGRAAIAGAGSGQAVRRTLDGAAARQADAGRLAGKLSNGAAVLRAGGKASGGIVRSTAHGAAAGSTAAGSTMRGIASHGKAPHGGAGIGKAPGAGRAAMGSQAGAGSQAITGRQVLTSARVRERLVERVRAGGVSDQRVLDAIATVPRHLFVDAGLATQAYEDAALPIGHHQTISKPSVVARMIELAMNGRQLHKVLEIGTGCGYQAAVLSHLATDVYSIERVKPLYERAKSNLRPLRVPNIRLHYGDGRLGLAAAAPFDAIVIAAAGLEIPQALLEQLQIGGRLVAPVGGQGGNEQVLTLVERVAPKQWRETVLDRVFFVPLKSGVI